MKSFPCALALLALAICRGGAAIATLTPSADTTISEDSLARADGVTGHMIVGHLDPGHANVPARGLLRFDLSSIPAEAIVSSATLRLAVTASGSAVNDTHELNALLADWTETGASWVNSGLASWEEGGSDFEWISDGSVSVAGIGNVMFTSAPGMIARVQSWITNSGGNRGWLLRSLSETEGRNARRFTTRESADPPVLTVTYTITPPAPPPGVMGNLRVADGKFVFEFTALPGTNYLVQFKNAVHSTNWLDLVSHPDPGTQTVFTVEHSLTESNRFYRLVTPPTP